MKSAESVFGVIVVFLCKNVGGSLFSGFLPRTGKSNATGVRYTDDNPRALTQRQ